MRMATVSTIFQKSSPSTPQVFFSNNYYGCALSRLRFAYYGCALSRLRFAYYGCALSRLRFARVAIERSRVIHRM